MNQWDNISLIGIWITITILFFFVIVVFFIFFAYISFKKGIEGKVRESELIVMHQKKLLEASIQIQEEERTRIASDLHDEIIGKLMRIRLRNEISQQNEEIEKLVTESIEETRRISHDLAPPMLDFKNLQAITEDIFTPWLSILNIHNYSKIEIEPDWNVKIKTQCIRILQETLNNIYKHASSTEVNIYIRATEQKVFILISDNGKGFDINKVQKGIGLYSLESRIQLVNSIFKIKSIPGKGSKFLFLFPNKYNI